MPFARRSSQTKQSVFGTHRPSAALHPEDIHNDIHNRNFYTLLIDLIVELIHNRWERCKRCIMSSTDQESNRMPKLSARHSSQIRKYYRSFRRIFHDLATHSVFIWITLVVILISTSSMAIEYHQQPEEITKIVNYLNVFSTILFTVEMLVKIIGFGFVKYIRNGFNLLDFVIVIVR